MLAPSSPSRLATRAQKARPVVRGDSEGGDAVVPLEFAHHDGGEDTRVDVAAAQDEADALALEALGLRQHRREARGAGALGHRPLQGRIGVHGALDQRLPRRG